MRLEACGICHTDLRMASRPGPRPIVLGHEGAGVVELVGEGVEDLAVGDPVLMSYGWCGRCASGSDATQSERCAPSCSPYSKSSGASPPHKSSASICRLRGASIAARCT